MEIIYLKSFYKDLVKLNDRKVKEALKSVISKVQLAERLDQIQQVKKLSGYPNAYRIKVKDYRLGMYKINATTLEMARFVKREDIYKVFPKK